MNHKLWVIGLPEWWRPAAKSKFYKGKLVFHLLKGPIGLIGTVAFPIGTEYRYLSTFLTKFSTRFLTKFLTKFLTEFTYHLVFLSGLDHWVHVFDHFPEIWMEIFCKNFVANFYLSIFSKIFPVCRLSSGIAKIRTTSARARSPFVPLRAFCGVNRLRILNYILIKIFYRLYSIEHIG